MQYVVQFHMSAIGNLRENIASDFVVVLGLSCEDLGMKVKEDSRSIDSHRNIKESHQDKKKDSRSCSTDATATKTKSKTFRSTEPRKNQDEEDEECCGEV